MPGEDRLWLASRGLGNESEEERLDFQNTPEVNKKKINIK